MVFKELEIQGFKSFPDKVKISFDTGVTGVVGPNGSGKSNLSDAVRWVLGETSSRQLRAAGKMEDVIFGGTRKRSPMGFAQVRLTLDNAAHTLDVDADEVTIGRKYYRSGDSEYTINGQVCRLRDVYELLNLIVNTLPHLFHSIRRDESVSRKCYGTPFFILFNHCLLYL